MTKHTMKADMMELSHSITMTIEMSRMKEWNIRINLVAFLLRIACWISPFKVKIIYPEQRPWLFYCPYCTHDTCGEILCDGFFTQQCNHCNRIFLAVSTPGKQAHAVKDPVCNQGCHFTEPFGWVISADCTEHDGIPG